MTVSTFKEIKHYVLESREREWQLTLVFREGSLREYAI